MPKFDNQAYRADNSDNEEKEDNHSVDSLTELLQAGELLEQLMIEKTEQALDLTALNGKRCNKYVKSICSNANCGIMKIGSLDIATVHLHMDDSISSVESDDSARKEKLTKHYINYFALLGDNENEDDFNFEFVDSLCRAADVNTRDIHGQSVMHEIAREWSTDVAYYLKTKGVNIDAEDNFGRTPLFVAVASNNIPMIKWLVENGANRNHRTLKGEGQLPIHYAARYDRIQSFDVLMELGVNPLVRDELGRTPFFLAAEAGNVRICDHFLDMELPTASYADNGESTIDHIVSNLPTILAERALNQYRELTRIDRSKANVYLSCLGKRRGRLLNPDKQLTKCPAPTVLEIITEKKDLKLINHPVVQQMIKVKENRFGNKFIQQNNIFYILFTFLWTIAASTRVTDYDDGNGVSASDRNFVLVITILAQMVTFVFIYKIYFEWKVSVEYIHLERKRLTDKCTFRRRFSHPRWSNEFWSMYGREETARKLKNNFWNKGWVMIEVFCLLIACVYTDITIVWYIYVELHKNCFSSHIRLFYSAFFVIVVWIRLNRCFKYHQVLGPFIVMLEECFFASCQIGFLFMEFFIPFAVAFWVIFGSIEVDGGNEEYMKFNDLLYQLWLLAFIGDYEYDTLKLIAPLMAQIFVGLYLVVVSIITINIYIALLSEAFARVSENASQRCYMEEAIFLINIERMFPEIRKEFEVYLNKFCAPMIVNKKEVWGNAESGNTRTVVSNVAKIATELSGTLRRIIDCEMANKQDLRQLEETFQQFYTKFDDKTSKLMVKRVADTLQHQCKAVPSALKRTNDIIIEYINMLKERAHLS